MKTFILLVLFTFVFTSCKKNESKDYKGVSQLYNKNSQVHPGKKLMETYCYACHDATTSDDKRLAPPMIAIKKRYIFKNTTKEEFIKDMQEWIKNPNEKDAKMFGAVRRFGVMQKLLYPEEVIRDIADYMFDNKIEQPEWFDAHYNQMKGNRKY